MPETTAINVMEFLRRELPAKEPLVEGLLYRRDLVALGGRRRHGKTTFLSNLAVALAGGEQEFLGYTIPRAVRVLFLFLEDDSTELQEKLVKVVGPRDCDSRFYALTRDLFKERGCLEISVQDLNFKSLVARAAQEISPDLVIVDNMAHLVKGDYNNSTLVHEVGKFCYDLATGHNCAVIVPAHPRKRGQDEDKSTLKSDPEGFFENIMGSSHFINSFGSLWGLERELDTDRTMFLGGAQRYTGQFSVSVLEKGEDDWFRAQGTNSANVAVATEGMHKKRAWSKLTGEFTREEALTCALEAGLSETGFRNWWDNYLVRLNLVKANGVEGKWIKAQ